MKGDAGAGLVPGLAYHVQRGFGLAVVKAHEVFLVVAPDGDLQLVGKGVDHRDADAVQAAGHLVRAMVEFSPGVKLGHDDLGRRNSFLGMDVHGNPAPIIHHRHRFVGVERHRDEVAESAQRLVDGIVHHLIDHVVQARSVIGVADIHAGALAHGVEPAQHLDLFGVIVALDLSALGHIGRFGSFGCFLVFFTHLRFRDCLWVILGGS